MRRIAVALLALVATMLPAAAEPVVFSDAERTAILRHGPWPMPWRPDPSNRVSGVPAAVSLGERLFFEPRLSGPGTVSCATCHRPDRLWSDGVARSAGLALVDRNAPSLLDVRLGRWFGWDGAGDSLWALSIRPLLDEREMKADAGHVARLIREDADLACRYRSAFGEPAERVEDERLLVDAGKALAAFQETLTSDRTPFDDFRDALASDDAAAMARYPAAAQRGLKLFVGDGGCALCHTGPRFTNGEFHDVGVPFFVARGKVDPGRHGGIRRLGESPFTLLGRHSDDAAQSTASGTRHVALLHRNWGEFRVPSLRNVALTAPYMHAGSHATLPDVVRHYSELDEGRLHADGERILRPLHLSPEAAGDMVAFLESLTDPAASTPSGAAATPPCRP